MDISHNTTHENNKVCGADSKSSDMIIEARWIHDCTKCGSTKDVDTRYSFGVYAGRLCLKCCGAYRDNCGVGQPQGDYRELDEPYWEE